MIIPEIVLVPLSARRWRVQDDFVVEMKTAGCVQIPSGFICDLNSMPRFLWWASTPTDYPQAGAVHDFLYHVQAGQARADAAYLEILLTLGMSKWRARLRYHALRMFGRSAYRLHAGAHSHA